MELKNGPVKPPSPLNFNKTWLKDDTFVSLISTKWIPFDPVSGRTASFQFVANIHNLKDAIKGWVVDKRRREDRELKQVEKDFFESGGQRTSDQDWKGEGMCCYLKGKRLGS